MSNGKGDRSRVTNHDQFRKNFDKVFDKEKFTEDLTKMIEQEQKLSSKRQNKKIKIVKEYTDRNGIKMAVININDSLTNTIVTKRQLDGMNREIVNEDYLSKTKKDDVIDVTEDK